MTEKQAWETLRNIATERDGLRRELDKLTAKPFTQNEAAAWRRGRLDALSWALTQIVPDGNPQLAMQKIQAEMHYLEQSGEQYCCYCGDSLIVRGFKLLGCSETVYAHNDCVSKLDECETYDQLPYESPLRRTWLSHSSFKQTKTK